MHINLIGINNYSPNREYKFIVKNEGSIDQLIQNNTIAQGVIKFRSPTKFFAKFDDGEILSSVIEYKFSRMLFFIAPLVGFTIKYNSNKSGNILTEKNKIFFSIFKFSHGLVKCVRIGEKYTIQDMASAHSSDMANNINIVSDSKYWRELMIIFTVTILRNLDN